MVAMTVGSISYAAAQYYESRDHTSFDNRYVTAGFVDRRFTPWRQNSLPDSVAIHYKRVMPMVSFKQGMAEVFLGYTTFDLSGSSKSTILFGGRFGAEVTLAGRRPHALLFPVELAADYTKAEGIGPSREDFNIASVGIGAGLKYRYFSSGVELTLAAEEFAQYASEGIGVGSGFSATTLSEAILRLGDVGILDGIVLGYRFRLQTWSMSESKFDYRSVSHGPYVGVMF